MSNPQHLSMETHVFRIRTLYLQCLCVLRFHIDIWYDFCQFEVDHNNLTEAESVLNNACEVLNDSLIIHFLLSDFLEKHNKLNEAKNVFEKLIEKYKDNNDEDNNIDRLTLIFVEYERFLLRTEGLNSARCFFRNIIQTKKCGAQLYITTANMELENTNSIEIARKIYQLGYTYFSDDPIYLLKYINIY